MHVPETPEVSKGSKYQIPFQKQEVAPEGSQPVSRNSDWTPVRRSFGGKTMVLVPAGSFQMGSKESDREKPIHTQSFSKPFWIDETPVTRADYQACVSAGACEPLASNEHSEEDNQPINFVTWYQAVAYCKWRGVSLPTEAEWEYAARGPDGLVYPWGNEFAGNKLCYSQNSGNKTATVGNYPNGASWVGALDMVGNVWEWTSSLHQNYPYVSNSDRELTGNEKSISENIVLRGGSFLDGSAYIRAARRYWFSAGADYDYNGFRCARS